MMIVMNHEKAQTRYGVPVNLSFHVQRICLSDIQEDACPFNLTEGF